MMRPTLLTAAIATLLAATPISSQAVEATDTAPAKTTEDAAKPSLRPSLPDKYSQILTRYNTGLFQSGHDWLEKRGLLVNLDLALLDQYATSVAQGANNAPTFAWQLFADYELFHWDDVGNFHLGAAILGSVGIGYAGSSDSLSNRTGSVSLLNGNVYPEGLALDEVYLQYSSPKANYSISIGKIDMSDYFDQNRVANDPFRQFFAFTFENSLSIPYPVYGDSGLLARWIVNEDIYVMFGAGIASSVERVPFWDGLSGAWWELLEAGITVRPSHLGRGTYRLTGWQSNVDSDHGLGVSLSADQELGVDWLVGFLRVGFGDPDQTTIRAAMSFGISVQAPFRRANDAAGVGFSWADSVASDQNEKLIEAYYRFSLTERLAISPDLQILVDPALQSDLALSVITGVRLLWSP